MLEHFSPTPTEGSAATARGAGQAARAPRRPRSPAEAIEALLAQARAGGAARPEARRVSVLAATATAPILIDILREAEALAEIDAAPRVVLGRAGRDPQTVAQIRAALPAGNLRVAEFRGARALYEQAVIGFVGQWTGKTLAWRPAPVSAGGFIAFDAPRGALGAGGGRRAALAHAGFEAAWSASTTL